MQTQQDIRHWLAMHCSEPQANFIYNRLEEKWHNEAARARHGLTEPPTMALCRYVWADMMLATGKIPTQPYLSALNDQT
jgi:hypothetical protein